MLVEMLLPHLYPEIHPLLTYVTFVGVLHFHSVNQRQTEILEKLNQIQLKITEELRKLIELDRTVRCSTC